MLKLKLQYFGHLMWKVDSLEKTLMLGGIGGRRRRGRQRMRWLDGITDLIDMFEWTPGVGDGQGGLACCDSWGRRVGHTEKAMAPHSSTLAWRVPWMEEPGRLQSMGSVRVGHDWATSLSLFTFTHWRRKWQPTPVSLPGESQGRGSLVGCRLWGRTESDTTEAT